MKCREIHFTDTSQSFSFGLLENPAIGSLGKELSICSLIDYVLKSICSCNNRIEVFVILQLSDLSYGQNIEDSSLEQKLKFSTLTM